MPHPIVTQLWFARSEFVRCLEGVSAEDAQRRLEPMNSLSWIIGHLANQENYLWVKTAQGLTIAPDLRELVAFGQPASTPPWEEMWKTWQAITEAADDYLTTITQETLSTFSVYKGKQHYEDVGTSLLRNIFHYWFHLGEAHAIRQMLGHTDLPQFVGSMSTVQHQVEGGQA